jgi:hypothetical protein
VNSELGRDDIVHSRWPVSGPRKAHGGLRGRSGGEPVEASLRTMTATVATQRVSGQQAATGGGIAPSASRCIWTRASKEFYAHHRSFAVMMPS